MKKIFIILIFGCLLINNANAQKGYTEVNFTDNFFSLPGLYISDVDFDSNGDVWMSFGREFPLVSIQGAGIAKWDGNSIVQYSNIDGKLMSNSVYAIACTKFSIWIGTDVGLQSQSKSNNLSNGIIYSPGLTQKGLGKKILALKEDNGFMWIGSDNGLGKLEINNINNFTYYGSNLWGKANAMIYTIAKGDNGDIWLGTNGGIVKMSANNTYTVYDKSNSGLLCDSIYSLYWRSDKKELWIGSESASKNGQVYFGMSVLRSGIINPIEEVVDCGFKEVDRIPSRIFNITETKTGEIVASLGMRNPSLTALKPSLIKIDSKNRLSKYFLKTTPTPPSTAEREVYTSEYLPLHLKKMPNGQLWLGAFDQRAFIINDFSKIANEDENLSVLQNAAPEKLDINQVSALALNNGDMFWDLFSQSKYEVPKNTCKSPIFASALWMGGIDGGKNLHTAAMTYRYGIDYFPGPLDTISASSPTGGDSSYLKIWKINNWEIQDFKKHYADGSLANGSYTPPGDFVSWPAHGTGNYSSNLAPFVDVDNNGIYEPLQGDYPKIKGEQALYWIFNDAGNVHSESQGLPLGVEVHAMAYAYNCDSIQAGSFNEAINYTTFYEYKIINRSTNQYDSAYIGIWTDVDLGNGTDDYVGCNPENNFAFGYNGDNDDEGVNGYGENPPIISTVFLSDSMTNFIPYTNDYSIVGNPTISKHYYNLLRAKYKNDSGLVVPVGANKGMSTNLALSGTPYTLGEWNEAEVGAVKGERRYVQSTGPYTFNAGETKTFSYAIVYSREANQPNGLNTSWAKNLNHVKAVKNWYVNNNFPTCATKPAGLSIGDEIKNPLQDVKVVPNPFSGSAALVFNLSFETKGTIEVYNTLGQVVQSIPAQYYNAGENRVQLNLANQPTGIYFYVLKTEGGQFSGRMVNVNR